MRKDIDKSCSNGLKVKGKLGIFFVILLLVLAGIVSAVPRFGEDGAGQNWFGDDAAMITNSNGKAWGATETNFQAAIDDLRPYGGMVTLPNDPSLEIPNGINLTGWSGDCSITIEGAGQYLSTRLHGTCTGKPVLDLTNSHNVILRDFQLYGDPVNTPSIGILEARNTSAASAGHHYFYNLVVSGAFTNASLYNYASEENSYVNCQFQNVIITSNNTLHNITSDYKTILTGQESTGDIRFDAGSMLTLFFEGSLYDVALDTVIMLSQGTNAIYSNGASLYDSEIRCRVEGGPTYCINFSDGDIGGSIIEFTSFANADYDIYDTNLAYCQINCVSMKSINGIVMAGQSMTQCFLHLYDTLFDGHMTGSFVYLKDMTQLTLGNNYQNTFISSYDSGGTGRFYADSSDQMFFRLQPRSDVYGTPIAGDFWLKDDYEINIYNSTAWNSPSLNMNTSELVLPTSAPSTPVAGSIYMNTTTGLIGRYTGSAWVWA